MKIEGLDEFRRELKQIQKNANELSGENEVSFDELFSTQFMSKYTSFKSFDELLEAGSFVVNSKEDFEKIPDDLFDDHIAKNTNFDDWESMQEEAFQVYVSRKLGF